MKVIKPGTRVLLGEPGDTFEATVFAVQIDMNGRILYRCSWWSGRELKDVWLDGPLVSPADAEARPLSVGFVQE